MALTWGGILMLLSAYGCRRYVKQILFNEQQRQVTIEVFGFLKRRAIKVDVNSVSARKSRTGTRMLKLNVRSYRLPFIIDTNCRFEDERVFDHDIGLNRGF
ncbi:hypothetical protein ACOME3_001275 [Neoechinorhynchus agilis]